MDNRTITFTDLSNYLLNLDSSSSKLDELVDRRTKGWLLVDSYTEVLGCIGFYYLIVLIGPNLMKNRKPFQLKFLMISYNFLMCLLNLYIFLGIFLTTRKLNYSYVCQPYREIFSEEEIFLAKLTWWFYISKIIEFCDTFFFILRKKDKQLSFLHIFHHSTMFPIWWIGTKWVPTGSSFFPAMENSFVHVIMYLYYALAAFGKRFEKYLWWKKYLTLLQLIQFVIAALYSIRLLLINCDYPLWISYTQLSYMIIFLFLFGKFYISSYIKAKKSNKVQ
ncbi:elongation of very long chain fatty acids protein 4-like [Condylostylus longicornis]|uniref:elongation of very long chain fatty acids protein 4-like n=1 Tax=Condylostylus longicornis TaxID=2530218 RepID=UPI00244DE926|nr:elongation of very long chain fatty acids protein 4-like [Condylostylus longicornis]